MYCDTGDHALKPFGHVIIPSCKCTAKASTMRRRKKMAYLCKAPCTYSLPTQLLPQKLGIVLVNMFPLVWTGSWPCSTPGGTSTTTYRRKERRSTSLSQQVRSVSPFFSTQSMSGTIFQIRHFRKFRILPYSTVFEEFIIHSGGHRCWRK